ncbi:hypothetical protein EDB19DRAFT_557071 [Suillus lakei]|nr:hypothetical protein EDB19DRAFT_557071 [Suillus lakei]
MLCFCIQLMSRKARMSMRQVSFLIPGAGLRPSPFESWYIDILVLFPILSALFCFCIDDPLLFGAVFHVYDLFNDFTIQFICTTVIVNVCLHPFAKLLTYGDFIMSVYESRTCNIGIAAVIQCASIWNMSLIVPMAFGFER